MPRWFVEIISGLTIASLIGVLVLPFMIFYGPYPNVKQAVVGALITSRYSEKDCHISAARCSRVYCRP